MLLIDCLIVFFSGFSIYFFPHRGYATMSNIVPLSKMMAVYVVLSMLSFRIFSTYAGVIRYSSFVDLLRVGFANVLAFVLCAGVQRLILYVPQHTFAHFSLLQLVGVFVFATVLMWLVRVVVKLLYDITAFDHRVQHALIYGVKAGGIGLARYVYSQRPARFIIKGFINHDNSFRHNLLMGKRVYNSQEDIAAVIRNKGIEAVLVSPLRTEDFRNNQSLQDLLIGAGCKIYFSKMPEEWNAEKEADSTKMRLNEVSVEDLLPREEIKVDLDSVARELSNRRILITGAAGSIGSEMVRQVALFHPASMMLIDQAETPEHDIRLMMARQFPDIKATTIVTSICKQGCMERIFREFRPDYVFHAAAYKHVPMMEDNPSEAVQNNIYGTKVIADLSVKYGVRKFVMVSTDKAVNPTNVMGCSKRICEIYVQSLNSVSAAAASTPDNNGVHTQFVTTRFGNVLGSNGSVIPLFKQQIKEGGPVTVTHPDIIRFFMLISEACKLVLEAGVKGGGGDIFVFDMGKPVKIANLAKRMIQLSGAKNVKIKFTGLRAGEKLYEEVLSEQEGTKPSFHEKIRIAEVRRYDFSQVTRDVDELIDIADRYDNMATVAKMKEMVPEYVPNNSVYDQLNH
jgi:FlaA1/EpsC-like NDP-sugar epimerase